MNTDAQDLLYTNADKKILIGKELTQGLGAGSNPKIGEEAAKESESEIKKLLEHSDLIFITCGFGRRYRDRKRAFCCPSSKKDGHPEREA